MPAPRPAADGGSNLGFVTTSGLRTYFAYGTITMSSLTPGDPYSFRWDGYGWRHRAGVSRVEGGLYDPADISSKATNVTGGGVSSQVDETFDAQPYHVDITHNAAAVQHGNPGSPGTSIWTDPEIGAGDSGAGFVFWPTGTSVTFHVWVEKREYSTDGQGGADYYGGGTSWPPWTPGPVVGAISFGMP